ncbi:MAG: putative MATE family efflux protein [Oceanicoccus sp.]|jgi:putative MATE family efflux protein
MASDLSQGAISTWLYRLTAPMVLGILSIFLFNLVDTYFISLLGTEPLAAVSFTFPVTMMIMNLAIGLSIATGAVVARSLGQKQIGEARNWVTASLYLSLLLGIILAAIGIASQTLVFRWLGADEKLLGMISDYMTWWYLGSVLLIVLIIVNASIRATGNTKLPSMIMLGSSFINGILDPLLIFGLGPFPELGMQGAAIATAISWGVAFILVIKYLLDKDLISLAIPDALLSQWQQLANIGIPAALTNMLGPIANGIMVAWVAQYGTHAVAAYGVGSRIEPLAMIVIMAFTASLPPFVGQNHGAGEDKRIEEALIKSMKFLFVWQVIVYALLVVFAQGISAIFSNDPQVQNIIQTFIYIVPLTYFAMGFTLVTTATLNALHKTKLSLGINLLRLFIIYLPCAWLGQHFGGLTGLFYGCALGNLIMGVIILGLFMRAKNNQQIRQRLLNA